jgi:hypothetical protein
MKPLPAGQAQPGARRWRRTAVWSACSTVLAAVFWAYLQPDMAFALATRAWACF